MNDQLATPVFSVLGVVLRGLSLRHSWRPSALSRYAYHHFGATPLMSSVLTSSFEAPGALFLQKKKESRDVERIVATMISPELGMPGDDPNGDSTRSKHALLSGKHLWQCGNSFLGRV